MMNSRAAMMLKGQPRSGNPAIGMPMTRPPGPGGGFDPLAPMVKPMGGGMPMTRPPGPGGGFNPLAPMVKPVGGQPPMPGGGFDPLAPMVKPAGSMGQMPAPGGFNPLAPMVKPVGGGMPDWRRTMMGGGMGMLNPMTLPGMMGQNAPGGGGGGGGGPPPTAPTAPTPGAPVIPPGPGPVKPAPVQTGSGVNGVMYRMPDGGMFDIYGNTWSPFGQLFGPGNSG